MATTADIARVPPVIALNTPPAPFLWPAGMLALVPVYNHAHLIGPVIQGLLALGAPVLVVDDGSTDGSGEAARQAGAEVITQAENQGKASALRRGFAEAEARGYAQVLTCDADGQHPTSEVQVVADAARDQPHSIVIGRRDMGCAPLLSRIGRNLSNFGSRVLCGTWPGDSQSGLRVYPIPAVNRLQVPARRYAYEVEVLIRGVWAGLSLSPVAVQVLYPVDRVTHFRKVRDNTQATLTFFRLLGRRLLPIPHKQVVEPSEPSLSAP